MNSPQTQQTQGSSDPGSRQYSLFPSPGNDSTLLKDIPRSSTQSVSQNLLFGSKRPTSLNLAEYFNHPARPNLTVTSDEPVGLLYPAFSDQPVISNPPVRPNQLPIPNGRDTTPINVVPSGVFFGSEQTQLQNVSPSQSNWFDTSIPPPGIDLQLTHSQHHPSQLYDIQNASKGLTQFHLLFAKHLIKSFIPRPYQCLVDALLTKTPDSYPYPSELHLDHLTNPTPIQHHQINQSSKMNAHKKQMFTDNSKNNQHNIPLLMNDHRKSSPNADPNNNSSCTAFSNKYPATVGTPIDQNNNLPERRPATCITGCGRKYCANKISTSSGQRSPGQAVQLLTMTGPPVKSCLKSTNGTSNIELLKKRVIFGDEAGGSLAIYKEHESDIDALLSTLSVADKSTNEDNLEGILQESLNKKQEANPPSQKSSPKPRNVHGAFMRANDVNGNPVHSPSFVFGDIDSAMDSGVNFICEAWFSFIASSTSIIGGNGAILPSAANEEAGNALAIQAVRHHVRSGLLNVQHQVYLKYKDQPWRQPSGIHRLWKTTFSLKFSNLDNTWLLFGLDNIPTNLHLLMSQFIDRAVIRFRCNNWTCRGADGILKESEVVFFFHINQGVGQIYMKTTDHYCEECNKNWSQTSWSRDEIAKVLSHLKTHIHKTLSSE